MTRSSEGDHVIGGEGIAIMELDALPELEAPDGRLHRLQDSANAGSIWRSPV